MESRLFNRECTIKITSFLLQIYSSYQTKLSLTILRLFIFYDNLNFITIINSSYTFFKLKL